MTPWALGILLAGSALAASAPLRAAEPARTLPRLVEGAPNTRPIVLGDDADACGGDAEGPAVRVEVAGLKERSGYLRAELYPATREDFLKPDRLLEAEGKPFRRAWRAVPPAGPAVLCLKAPQPGQYALAVVHVRERRWKFDVRRDGAGFSNNPRLGLGRPPVERVAFAVGGGVTRQTVVMNYLQGLAFRPLPAPAARWAAIP
ncbi:MAG: DUF2141 domain-containing protein [Sphingomonadaceae bacterium]|uniref:DUF2141 domain-containing protein n=1 Tax=Thermaurantiacus sp. TaxID=2820283 RepID=UPI00298F010B|nr:DUF2141 domain-containing protein [Thermaurantiacus sp.]MCS6986252.1 DUF2141 domain-containing protein [Sphingomonadaceae bacterium]MDW8415699.1 DUF2141 domain-containing protein [Thermaurantiacus sp.]